MLREAEGLSFSASSLACLALRAQPGRGPHLMEENESSVGGWFFVDAAATSFLPPPPVLEAHGSHAGQWSGPGLGRCGSQLPHLRRVAAGRLTSLSGSQSSSLQSNVYLTRMSR